MEGWGSWWGWGRVELGLSPAPQTALLNVETPRLGPLDQAPPFLPHQRKALEKAPLGGGSGEREAVSQD